MPEATYQENSMTRLQDNTMERFSLAHGRVAVREGFADGHVEMTVPDGANFRVTPDGVPHEAGVNFSLDWSYS